MEIPNCKKTVLGSSVIINKDGKKFEKSLCQFDVMGTTYYKSLYRPVR